MLLPIGYKPEDVGCAPYGEAPATDQADAKPPTAFPFVLLAINLAIVREDASAVLAADHTVQIRRMILLYIAAALFGLTYSIGNIGCLMVTREISGTQRYNQVYPKVAMCATISNALATSLMGFMYDASGAYISALSLALGLLAVLVITLLSAYRYAKG